MLPDKVPSREKIKTPSNTPGNMMQITLLKTCESNKKKLLFQGKSIKNAFASQKKHNTTYSSQIPFNDFQAGKSCSNSSINKGRRVFLTRLPGGRRFFVTYQWGKPQLDEGGNAKGASVPRRQVIEKTSPKAKSKRKVLLPRWYVRCYPPVIELTHHALNNRTWGLQDPHLRTAGLLASKTNSCRGTKKALALYNVSSYSFSGTESYTIPPPAP